MSIKPPKPLAINNDIDMAREWSEWLEMFECFSTATKLGESSAEIQIATFKAIIGRDGVRLINNIGLTDTEKSNLNTVKAKLNAHFKPKRNKTYERCQFHRIKQQQEESFEDFLQKLREQVSKCSFTNDDEFVTDQIVLGIYCEDTRQRMWIEEELTLDKAIKICRAAERANREINEISGASKVNKISKEFTCKRCGNTHGPRNCPAFGKACLKCNKKGHFANMCNTKGEKKQEESKEKAKGKKRYNHKNVNVIESDDSEDDISDDSKDFAFIGSIKDSKNSTDKWSTTVKVGQNNLKLKLDTGAHCNVLSLKQAKKLKANLKSSATKRLVAYNNESIKVVGEAKIRCSTKKADEIVTFKIINEDYDAILGRDMCEKLGLIIRVDKIKHENSKSNELLGCYKNYEYDIDLIDNPTFKIIPARRIPYAIQDKVKAELDRMVEMGVIKPISEPTPAVSPMLVVNKGKIRICMDPTELNKNIQRRIYPMKTVEEIAAKVNGSKFFTKLDCQKGFWQIKVTKRTSQYLTFSTPWGRYCYLRLPFGISSAPEVFSELMNRVLDGIEQCEVAMDDIFIYGKTSLDVQKTTEIVIKRLKQAGFTLNKEKCEYNKKTVKFLGHIFSENGCKVDPTKIEAIHSLKEPTCVKELQRTLGMVNYLGKFINNLSELTDPLRQLIRKENAWAWGPEQRNAFENIKKTLTQTPVLAYFDVNAPVKLSVDASSKSMGACLMQKNRPVAYAAKALTESQQKLPQITKEAMAIRFGCTKFHEYVYGKELAIESDHKPLETIFKNPIHEAPLRLQGILFDILQYSPKVIYIKGNQIPIADTLSRDCEHADEEADDVYAVHIIHAVSDKVHNQLLQATEKDMELQALKEVIASKWPDDQDKLPRIIRKYFSFRHLITYENGLLLKGNKIILPESQIQKIISEAHTGHAGISKTISRIRQTFYSYGMSTKVKDFVEKCAVCQQSQKSNRKEPLIIRGIPEYPFQLVSTDIFKFKGDDFLLIADHYSGFSDFKKLKSSTSAEVVLYLKQWFAVHGIPEVLESDGGPQYTSSTFKKFVQDWEFKHRISSPHYPQSNGYAERNVQTVKGMLKRCWRDGSDPYLAMLMLRNTPRNEVLKSPAERLFSRNTRSTLPVDLAKLKPQVVTGVTNELQELRENQKRYADRIAAPRPSLQVGDDVRMKVNHREWQQAKVVQETENPRSVIVETPNKRIYRRNHLHLHKTKAKIPTSNGTANLNFNETNDDTQLVNEQPNLTANQDQPHANISNVPSNSGSGDPSMEVSSNGQLNQPRTSRYGRVLKPVIKYDV